MLFLAALLVSACAPAAAFAPAPRAAPRVAPRHFFDKLFGGGESPAADAELDNFVKKSRAVLFTDGSAASPAAAALLKQAKCDKYTEVRLDLQPLAKDLAASLKRRVGAQPPVLIVADQVFDKAKIEYLCKQDMMLPVFRAAGTSGEVRLPFQDLRFYLKKVNDASARR
ncbi:hypothetical protein M885DRAFT_505833 [Pelagophyceae sp. CCMP2097]|nr:hypothetical protein M885DRAFT_505833 [Pelagophyceae sp. CCMP2097]|mmetsp:Transcript_9901/g.34231  ORF Transcript_9901/g.34231 Transcript_9901/m.34231 type:complete len:169 (+) Transcript_9901:133-639(+)